MEAGERLSFEMYSTDKWPWISVIDMAVGLPQTTLNGVLDDVKTSPVIVHEVNALSFAPATAMDHRGQRPPRSARPPGPQPQPPTQSPPPSYPAYTAYPSYPDQPATTYRPPYPQGGESPRGISFQNTEAGDRHDPLDQNRHRHYSAYQSTSPPPMDVEGGYGDGRVGRKKSLVRPDREKIDPGHRQWHYRNHAAQMLTEGGDALPSSAYLVSFLSFHLYLSPPRHSDWQCTTQGPATPREVFAGPRRGRARVGARTLQAWNTTPEEVHCGRRGPPTRRPQVWRLA